MSYIYDAQAGGYRLTCESCSSTSPVISTEERAAQRIEWWCSTKDCERHHLAVQRERFMIEIERKGLSPERAETETQKLRWDLMSDGKQVLSD